MKKHLASFRKGWQSENIARYILSNFAFISQPSTIADDLGSDFFCTIFDTITNGNNNFLLPKESFAIQIKSNRKPFYITGKTEYLKSLGIPFFVGVCNKKSQELEFYSGEYLIPFFVDEPSAEKIKIKLCDTDDCKENRYAEDDNEFTLKFPKLFTIKHRDASRIIFLWRYKKNNKRERTKKVLLNPHRNRINSARLTYNPLLQYNIYVIMINGMDC